MKSLKKIFDLKRKKDDKELEILRRVAEVEQEEDEGESSNQPTGRTRIYIHRDREGAAERLFDDYFAQQPRYPPDRFKRRFRMRRQLFLRIVQDIVDYSVEPLPDHFAFFRERIDALGRHSCTSLQKCTSALRQLAYGSTPDSLDEYLQMGESTSVACLDNFCKCVMELYVDEYLRKPNANDIARLYTKHEEKHGFRGMLGSIDCMHWRWKNCPVGWKGQYTNGHKGQPTIVLEAVASYDTWIWHAYFGAAGANNDINVLNQSSLFDDVKNGVGPQAPFTVNGHDYTHGYYLADDIYPDWATLIKAPSCPTDEPRAKFKIYQESARKDVERAFGVLQARFWILQMPARAHSVNKMTRIMYCCVLLHNMIVEDNGYAITLLEEELLGTEQSATHFVRNRTRNRRQAREIREKEIRDRNVHNQLEADLTAHIWNLPPNFRSGNT